MMAVDGRVAGAWVGGEKLADCGGALGHPRPVVEQARDGEERRQVDLDRFAAEAREPFGRLVEQRLDFPVAEEREVVRLRGAPKRKRFGAGGSGPSIGVSGARL